MLETTDTLNPARELARGWKAAVDPENGGKEDGWTSRIVNEAVDAAFPGYIADTFPDFHRGVAWFWNRFDLDGPPDPAREYYLQFGYTEYFVEYWLNGNAVGSSTLQCLNYEFEVGGSLRGKENLLAVRVISPTKDGIDGYYFGDYSDPNNIVTRARGANSPFGGIFYPVRLSARRKLRGDRLVVRPDFFKGTVSVQADIVNHTSFTQTADLSFDILSPLGEPVSGQTLRRTLAVGTTNVAVSTHIDSRLPWDTDTPNLYTLHLTVCGADGQRHLREQRFGFRDFRVKDGYFHLNDKRILVRSTHVAPVTPFCKNGVSWDMRHSRDDILRYKATGLNMIRFLSSNPYPEYLDFCDEIGLMVHEEHAASWWMNEKNPFFEEQFATHVRGVARRDINHPSVVIFGMANEAHHERERACIRSMLAVLREEDEQRFALLDSGRWDGDFGVGSLSNPDSHVWEHQWGAEAPDAGKVKWSGQHQYGIPERPEYGFCDPKDDGMWCWYPDCGDVHMYTHIPLSERSANIIRTHGKGRKPAFISEGGACAMENPLRVARKHEQEHGLDTQTPARLKYVLYRGERFSDDFKRYGLDRIYPSPEDVIADSYAANLVQRDAFFACVRSNPQICGISFSSGRCFDDNHDRFVPLMSDAMSTYLAPLTWCLFVSPQHPYVGQPVTVEAVLASEDVLRPGTYPIRACLISTETGSVWTHETDLVIGEPTEGRMNPLAFPVLKEQVSLSAPSCRYTLAVTMLRGGTPAGGRLKFTVSQPEPPRRTRVQMIGLEPAVSAWLNGMGITDDADADLLVVGFVSPDDGAWEQIYAKVRAGASALFLQPEAFLVDVDNPYDHKTYVPTRLPMATKGFLIFAESWYYHPYFAMLPHPYHDGFGTGLIRDDVFMLATPQFIFHGQDVPDETATVGIGLPYFTGSDEAVGYLFGTALAVFKHGLGRIVLNCYKLNGRLGKNPAADKLLLNIIDHETRGRKAD